MKSLFIILLKYLSKNNSYIELYKPIRKYMWNKTKIHKHLKKDLVDSSVNMEALLESVGTCAIIGLSNSVADK